MKIDVSAVDRALARRVSPSRARRWARAMLVELDLPRAELSVLLADDATVHELNRSYRHKDRPTDVLSFAQREGEGGDPSGDVLGDVVISLDTAERQARERRRPLDAEVTFLLAHGVLHLLGWDHRDDAEEREMNARTRALVRAAKRAEADATASRAGRGAAGTTSRKAPTSPKMPRKSPKPAPRRAK